MQEIDGIKVYFFTTRTYLSRILDEGYIPNFRCIKWILESEKPDIIYQRMATSATGILQFLSKKIGFKFVWACASDSDLWRLKLHSAAELRSIPTYLLKRRGISRADTILVQTNQQKKLVETQFHRDAILQKNTQPVPTDVLVKSVDELRIVWVANFKPLKQPDLFIDLAVHFQGLTTARFIMFGRPGYGEWQCKLESRMRQLENLSYMGSVSQKKVNDYLCGAHILVNTSEYEGFSNTFIQAWMRKIPVVSLNVDPDRLLSEGGLGFYSENFQNLCRDVGRLINDRQLRESIGEKACQYACEHHSIDKIGRQFRELLEMLHSTGSKALDRTEYA